jgi:hypothetical protein
MVSPAGRTIVNIGLSRRTPKVVGKAGSGGQSGTERGMAGGATSLALGAVTPRSDPPTTPVAADGLQLPASAMPAAYFGGGETVTSIAE